MKLHHAAIEQEDGWFIGRALERIGITKQGRSLDELVYMVREAIKLMWKETDEQLELIVPWGTVTSQTARKPRRRVGASRSKWLPDLPISPFRCPLVCAFAPRPPMP
jgi:predicted RNase H-like HicB family nuclease